MKYSLITQHVKQDLVANRLMELMGVGPLIASALVAAIGDGKQCSKGRDFAIPRFNSPSAQHRG